MTAELTDRQLQILRLAGEGRTTKQIAARLHLRDKIVEHDIGGAMASLGVRSRTAVVVKAIKLRLLPLDKIDV